MNILTVSWDPSELILNKGKLWFQNLQIWEPPCATGSLSKQQSLSLKKYLCRITFFHYSFFRVTNLQRILEPRAKLEIDISFIPNPPHTHEALKMFQLNTWKRLELDWPHFQRNCLSSWAIAYLILVGESRVENWKIRRVGRTDLIRTTHPVGFNH